AFFDVGGAAAIEEAVNFVELEGIEVRRPVLLEGLHHIQMGEKEDGLVFSIGAPVQTHHEVVFVGHRPEYLDVFRRKTGSAKAGGHGFRRGGDISGRRVRSVDLNQLSKNVARELLRGRKSLLSKGKKY